MRNWLLSLIAWGVLAGTSRADYSQPVSEVGEAWDRLREVPVQLAGRALGGLVRKGMTEEQVRSILGKNDRISTGFVFSSVTFYNRQYPELGVEISFVRGSDGVSRVEAVGFRPLFGGR